MPIITAKAPSNLNNKYASRLIIITMPAIPQKIKGKTDRMCRYVSIVVVGKDMDKPRLKIPAK